MGEYKMTDMTQEIQHIYMGIQDAMVELEDVKGTKQAMECLEIANNYCKKLMGRLEEMGLSKKQSDYFYYDLGIENPREEEVEA